MHVFLIAALTADGFIAEESDQVSTAWTSEADKKFFRDRTKQAGVMILGRKTYQTIGRPLPGRLMVVMSRDGESGQSSNWPVLSEIQASKGEVVFTNASPAQIIRRLEKLGYAEAAICGGSTIYTIFMKERFIETLYLTIEPVIFGEGVKLFNQKLDQIHDLSPQTKMLEYLINS